MARARADGGAEPVHFCDELGFGFGWMTPARPGLRRASHALAANGRVWVVDPVDAPGLDARIRALGEPAAVVQLLDRHSRDSVAVAARLAVPHHRPPLDALPDSPFELVPLVRRRFWWEAALWWPSERVLVCADALGTAPYYLARGERLAVHPFLRLAPPRGLASLAPEHVLVGHGEGLHGVEARVAVAEALASARRRIPGWASASVSRAMGRGDRPTKRWKNDRRRKKKERERRKAAPPARPRR